MKRMPYGIWTCQDGRGPARRRVPYGAWTCADGREVLFDRRYRPVLQRWPGTRAAPADPTEWVPFVRQTWLYDDATPRAHRAIAIASARAEWCAA
jgi:hypothetical protein